MNSNAKLYDASAALALRAKKVDTCTKTEVKDILSTKADDDDV